MPLSPRPPPSSDATGPLAGRPAVPLAALLVAGILLHDRLPPRPGLTLALAAVAAGAAAVCLGRRYVGSALLAVAVALAGAALAQREHYRFSTADVGAFVTDDARLATVEARVADEPHVVSNPAVGGRPQPPRQVFVADVTRVLTPRGWARATGQLPVRLNQPNPALAAGHAVQLLGLIERPRPAANPGEFDWAAYYRRLRVTATLTVSRSGNARVLAGPGFAPWLWARGKARHLLAAGFTSAHAADHAIVEALLLGEHDPQLRDAAADFQATGVAYQLSVSGLHVALLAGGVVWACRRRLMPPRRTLAVGTAFAVAYAAVSVPSHSGVRAVIVSAVLAAGLAVRRDAGRPQLVALAVIAMLVAHPLDLYTDGFQLSVAVVVAFLVLLPAVRRWWADDPDRPARRELTAFGRIAKAWGQVAVYGVIAWLATLPLVAAQFGQVTPWAVPGGVVLFPVVAVALYAGAAKVVLTLLFPAAAGPLATAAGWPAALMRAVAHALAAVPGGSVPVSAPPPWAVAAYYALLLLPLVRVDPGRRRWALRLAPVGGVAGLLAVSLGSVAVPPLPPAVAGPALRVTLLSLGAGQCAVVESPGGHAVVVDAGSSTVPDVAHRIVAPFLQARGERRLADVFLSHGDYDHISAAADLAAAFDAGAVFTSHHFRRNAAGNEPALDLLARLGELRLPPREVAVGDHVDLSNGAAVDVLWPPPDGTWNSNNAGLVLRLSYAGRRVLFPADIQDPAFAGLLARPEALAADVLVAPHHGSSESLTPAFLAAVHPSVIVSSNAARLTAKQRRFDAMVAALPGRPVPLYRTPQCGAITVTVTADGRVAVSTYLHAAAAVR